MSVFCSKPFKGLPLHVEFNPEFLLWSLRLYMFYPWISFWPYLLLFCCFGEGNGTPLQYSCLENPMDGGAWWPAVHGVTKSRTRLSDFTFTSHFHALEKEMATHSSVLAWRIPGTGEPDGLPSMGSHRVGHNWSNLAAAAASFYYLFPFLIHPVPLCSPNYLFFFNFLLSCAFLSIVFILLFLKYL